jgi:hypothetical protein
MGVVLYIQIGISCAAFVAACIAVSWARVSIREMRRMMGALADIARRFSPIPPPPPTLARDSIGGTVPVLDRSEVEQEGNRITLDRMPALPPPPRGNEETGKVIGHIESVDLDPTFLAWIDAMGGRGAREKTLQTLVQTALDRIETRGLAAVVSKLPSHSDEEEDETIVIDRGKGPRSGRGDREPPDGVA